MRHWGSCSSFCSGGGGGARARGGHGGEGGGASDVLVSSGSNPTPFSQNKQNEPAVAIDQRPPERPRGGLERRARHGGLQRRPGQRLPVHRGRRRVRDLLLLRQWPELDASRRYTGWSARDDCQGAPGTTTIPCEPDHNGPIGTLPRYDEVGLVADGDPALAFGPAPDDNGEVLVGQRLAALLREPGVQAARDQHVQGRRGDRRSRARTTSRRQPRATSRPGCSRSSRAGRRAPSSPTRSRSGRTTP